MAKHDRLIGFQTPLADWLTLGGRKSLEEAKTTLWSRLGESIQRRPLGTLAGAMVLGAMVGWLLKRR